MHPVFDEVAGKLGPEGQVKFHKVDWDGEGAREEGGVVREFSIDRRTNCEGPRWGRHARTNILGGGIVPRSLLCARSTGA